MRGIEETQTKMTENVRPEETRANTVIGDTKADAKPALPGDKAAGNMARGTISPSYADKGKGIKSRLLTKQKIRAIPTTSTVLL